MPFSDEFDLDLVTSGNGIPGGNQPQSTSAEVTWAVSSLIIGKVVKFRVDRMYKPEEAVFPYHPRPEDYDIEAYCNQVFMMYDGEPTHVTLRCDNAIMKAIIDRFGESVKTLPADEQHFLAEVDVSISPTFYSWVFTYGGKMQILSPESISKEYQKRLTDALKHCT